MRDRRAFASASVLRIGVCALVLAAAMPAGGEVPENLRVLVVAQGEDDVSLLRELKRTLGINTIVGNTGPKLATALAAQEAGLSYLAFLSSRDVERLESDEDYLAGISAIAAVPSFAGFHYLDDGVEEGFTAPETQGRTYAALKRLFPVELVLYPLRLDLASDPSYLDDYFRPEFTDFVVPYFYPVGRTTLGVYSYGDDWDAVLSRLLAGLRDRMPPGKGVLPVLQGFQQEGFAVQEEGFPQRQMDVYEAFWPEERNVAAFAWFDVFANAIPLSGMARSPALQSGFRRLFESLAGDDAPDPERDGSKGPPAVLTTFSGAAGAR